MISKQLREVLIVFGIALLASAAPVAAAFLLLIE